MQKLQAKLKNTPRNTSLVPSIRRQRYIYQPRDLVRVNKELFEVIGTHDYGRYVVVKNKNKKSNLNVKKINWTYHVGSLVFKNIKERSLAPTPHPKEQSKIDKLIFVGVSRLVICKEDMI